MAPALSLSVRDPHVDLRIDAEGGGLAGMLEIFGAYVGPGSEDPTTATLRVPDLPSPVGEDPALHIRRHGGLCVRLAASGHFGHRPLLALLHVRGAPAIRLAAYCGTSHVGTSSLHEDGPKVTWIDAPERPWRADLHFVAEGPPDATWSVSGLEVHLV